MMYEYHGWATVRETPENADEDRLDEIAAELADYFANLQWEPGVLDLRGANGTYQVWTAGHSNRKPEASHDPVRLFQSIGEKAPGSYGILYVWDDEDPEGYDNRFRAYVLARGELTVRDDPFLSPCVPVIEDE